MSAKNFGNAALVGAVSMAGFMMAAPSDTASADPTPDEEVTFVSRVVSREKVEGKWVEYVSGGRLIITEKVRRILKEEGETKVDCIHSIPKKSWFTTLVAGEIGTPYPEATLSIVARTGPRRIRRAKTLTVEGEALSKIDERFMSRHPEGNGVKLSELSISDGHAASRVAGLPSPLPTLPVGIRDGGAEWPPAASSEPEMTTVLEDRIIRYHPTTCWMFYAN